MSLRASMISAHEACQLAKESGLAILKAICPSSLFSILHLPWDGIELIIVRVERLAGLQDHRRNGERHDCQGRLHADLAGEDCTHMALVRSYRSIRMGTASCAPLILDT